MKKPYVFVFLAAILISSCSINYITKPNSGNIPQPHLEFSEPALNIKYSNEFSKNESSLALDIYPTEGAANPVVIFVHGGGWIRGDKSLVDLKPAAFNRHGYVFVSINYRLIPEVGIRQQLEDVAHSISWIHQNISRFGGDPNRLFLLGHSAGAHLVSLIGTDESYLESVNVPQEAIKGIASLDTQTYDLEKLLTNINEEEGGEIYWNTFGHDPEFWKLMSPAWHISSDKYIPAYFIAYTGDKKSRIIMSRLFSERLAEAGIPVILFPAIDKSHEQLNQDIGIPDDSVTKALFTWLDEIANKS